MRYIIRLTALLIIVFLTANTSWAVGTIFECEVTGWGEFPTGEMFEGTASDMDGTETINWMHVAPGISFETLTPDPDGIECRLNGTTSADFFGTGTATVNGEEDYSYFIEVEDNRPPPDIVKLTASLTRTRHRPAVRNDGVETFETPKTVIIPEEIDVLEGNSGRLGLVKLYLDGIKCIYRGTGPTYAFARCDSGNIAGDSLDILQARLRIWWAYWRSPITVVKANIGTGATAPGAPDQYSILVADSSGGIVYNFTSIVEDGDIDITLLDPILPPP